MQTLSDLRRGSVAMTRPHVVGIPFTHDWCARACVRAHACTSTTYFKVQCKDGSRHPVCTQNVFLRRIAGPKRLYDGDSLICRQSGSVCIMLDTVYCLWCGLIMLMYTTVRELDPKISTESNHYSEILVRIIIDKLQNSC